VLKTFSLSNFKAFADLQQIPLRPLTLIFGPNSSGKSSIIHGLVLGRQAQDTGNLDVHRTEVGGDAVDLGGFSQYIFHRDNSRRMEWAIEVDTAAFSGRLAELFAVSKRVSLTVQIGLALVEETRMKAMVDQRGAPMLGVGRMQTGELVPSGVPQVQVYEIAVDSAPILRASRRPNGRFQVDQVFDDHPLFRELLKSLVLASTTTESVQPSDYEGLADTIGAMVPDLSLESSTLLPDRLLITGKPVVVEPSMLVAVGRGTRQENLAAAVQMYFPRVLNEMISGLSAAMAEELKRFQYLGPLRSYPPRHIAFSQHHDPNWQAGGGWAWDEVRRNPVVREKVNSWLGSEERLQTPYALAVRELIAIDDLEPTLVHELDRLQEEGFGLEGEPNAKYTIRLADGDEKVVSEGSVHDVDTEAAARRMQDAVRGADVEKVQELVLIDRRTETIVTHRDVGIGISQVLPVLVAAYASQNRILAMEQPEIHLHPALQAELGDVFITSALGTQKNTFILETHSEHLILRILRRIRETQEGKQGPGFVPVRPEDVSILYVSPTKNGSVITEIPTTVEGDFATRWPEGFFPERAKELFWVLDENL
jgi:RecA/RadA recombinase